MAAIEVEQLLIRTEVTQRKIEKQLKAINDNARKRARGIESRYDRMARNVSRSFQRMARGAGRSLKGIAIGSTLGGGGLLFLTKQAVDAADAIGKTAASVGLSTDALQEYRLAAELSGTETEAFDKAIVQFAKRLGELRANTGSIVEFLNKYDASLVDALAATENTEEALDVFLRQLEAVENQADRSAFAFAGFGRAGSRMALLLRNEGVAGLNAMREAAQQLGLVLEEELITGGESAADAMTIMGRVLSVNINRVLLGLAPLIVDLGSAFGEAAPKIAEASRELFEFLGLGEQLRPLEDLQAELQTVEADITRLRALVEKPLTGKAAIFNKRNKKDLEEAIEREKELQDLISKREARNALIADLTEGATGDPDAASAERAARAVRENELFAALDKEFLERQQAKIDRENELAAAVEAEAEARREAAIQRQQDLDDLIAAEDELAEKTTESERAFSDLGEAGRSAFKGFLRDLKDGASLADALSRALERVADKAFDIALNLIFGTATSPGIFGFKRGGLKGRDRGVQKRRRGGVVRGRGGPTSDDNLVAISDGEFVVNARDTAENLDELEAINAGRRRRRFANGGLVGNTAASRAATPQLVAPAAAPAMPPVVVPAPVVGVRNLNLFDASELVSEGLSGRDGEQTVINVLRRNPAAAREAMGIT